MTLLKEMTERIRVHAIGSRYKAETGWDKPFEHVCNLCGSMWLPGQSEKHTKACLLTRAYKAIGQKAPIVELKPLR